MSQLLHAENKTNLLVFHTDSVMYINLIQLCYKILLFVNDLSDLNYIAHNRFALKVYKILVYIIIN